MSRFVIVSLVGLGFVFYELSGGSDFEPPVRPAVEPVALSKADNTPLTSTSRAQTAAIPAQADQLVQKAVLSSAAGTTGNALPAPARNADIITAALKPLEASLETGLETGFETGEDQLRFMLETESLQLASLEDGLSGGLDVTAQAAVIDVVAEAPQETVAPADIRAVRASRVNMRQGPNTSYPILTRLLAGDKVEIIEDEGIGWAMLRVEKTGQIGWIATSLLSPKGS